jgi:hypothetical protein
MAVYGNRLGHSRGDQLVTNYQAGIGLSAPNSGEVWNGVTIGEYIDALNAMPGVVGHWALNDTSGTSLVAAVGSAGTITGTFTEGLTGLVLDGGTSISTDGSTGEMTFPLPTLSATGWLAFWWSSTDASSVNITFRDNTSAAGSGYLWDVGTGSTGGGQFRVNGNNHTVTGLSLASMKTGDKHLILFDLDGSNAHLYVDGNLIDTWASTAVLRDGDSAAPGSQWFCHRHS